MVGAFGVLTGYYGDYHHISFQEVVRQSDEADLERLSFAEREYNLIQWVEEGKEFRLNGKMYDVSKIIKTEEGYIIMCENDRLEEMMSAFITFRKKSEQQQQSKKSYSQPHFFCSQVFVPPVPYFKEESCAIFFEDSFYHAIKPDISAPPPKSFFS